MQIAELPTQEMIEVPRAEYEQLQVDVRLLREQLKYLKHQLFGSKREHLIDHPELFSLEPEQPPEAPKRETKVAGHTRKGHHPGRHDFPDHLPREVVEVNLSEEERTCSQCGEQKDRIDAEITKELERTPAKLFVREYHREKCACRHCHAEVTTAPPPTRPIEKGIAGPGLLAQVVVDKFADHLPLYRQEKRFAREGVRLSRQTLCGWLGQLNDYAKHIVEAMKKELLEGDYIQADETPVDVQDRGKPGKNHQGYIWSYSNPEGSVVFDFQMSRARAGPKEFLQGYRGLLQHDGYKAYLKIGDQPTHVACMAHIRRGFWDARKAGEQRAYKVVLAINRLYKIERKARNEKLDAAARHKLRSQRAVARMDLLKQRIEKLLLEVLPQSKSGKACAYALGQWPAMVRYLEDGRIEIDNNRCENSIRPIALGRKNWLHIGSEAAGPTAANFMSLVETCRRLDIGPLTYFTDLFSRVAEHPINRIEELTPAHWATGRKREGEKRT